MKEREKKGGWEKERGRERQGEVKRRRERDRVNEKKMREWEREKHGGIMKRRETG